MTPPQMSPRRTRWWRRRLPVLLQTTAAECGAACLAMIAQYHGKTVSVAECHERCAIGRDGATAKTIASAARDLGFRVRTYSVTPLQLSLLPLPAIIHWNFNHFVALERWSLHRIRVVDPAIGARTLSVAEFEKGFTGIVMTLEPSTDFTRQHQGGETGRLTWRVSLASLRYVPGLRRMLFELAVVMVALQGASLTLPALTNLIVDRVLAPFPQTALVIIGIALLVVGISHALFGALRATLLLRLHVALDSRLMIGFFEHVLSLPYRFFQQHPTGDLLMRLGSSVVIRDALSNVTLSLLLDGVFAVIYVIALLVQSVAFGLVVLALGVLQAILILSTTWWLRPLIQRHVSAQAEAQNYLVEVLSGIKTLKASGGEDIAFDQWTNLFYQELSLSVRKDAISSLVNTANNWFRTMMPLLLLWLGAHGVMDGSLSLGAMLAMTTLASLFLSPLASILTAVQQLQLVITHLQRVADVMSAKPEEPWRRVLPQTTPGGRIELRNVSFRYTPVSPDVVQNVSLVIEPGEKIALIGSTGSGKSTLASLLIGLNLPTEGDILYDGRSIHDLDLRGLRGHFGVVLQENFLFNSSIRSNIAFYDPSLPTDRIIEAAQLAAIHDEIMAMPMGYETVVGEGGMNLSGGQRQRLALARAILHSPTILLLDEATSHLDVMTETVIDQNLSRLPCTRIVIAHRLSTVCNADRIVVLEGGRVVEAGAPRDLLAHGDGYYARFLQQQLLSDEAGTPLLETPHDQS